MIRMLLLVALVAVTSACVSPIPLKEQVPQASYKPDNTVLVAVLDERKRVKEGKDRTFIGVAHGAFGIPADWNVNPVLATQDGDKQRTLAQFIQHRLLTGLADSGWQVKPVNFVAQPSRDDVIKALQENGAEQLITLALKEWYFSINLNWVSSFNFDTDTDITLFDRNGQSLLAKTIAGRDVVEESASDSPQNGILRAYRAQLEEIFADPELRQLLEAHGQAQAEQITP
ncbi:hypothetical protein [Gallaecimonas sp. GXIMD4217]|uniref:hypothetical protein n=1 Tax=Gallaecimonas sp. GXIMD4217 TaxID=3131927 RepID=UPI00311AD7A7